jgi:tRNA (mo5U34)-methyltransferase
MMAHEEEMTPEQLREGLASIEWFHRIDLGGGVVTPGRDDSPRKLDDIRMPIDLAGRSVLDIGANDGYFSFAAERRGARRVVAVDSWGQPACASRRAIDFARAAMHSRVEVRGASVYELSAEEVGEFDVVLFLGVLYHLRDPLLALEHVASVTADLLILETHVDLLDHRRPVAAFYPGDELGGDGSNWWGPNVPAVLGMLRSVGFEKLEVVKRPAREGVLRKLARSAYNMVSKGYRLHDTQRWGRAVVHARKPA